MSVHLNNILSSYNNYLVNLESIRKSHFDLIGRYIRPEQVISLILSDKKDTPIQSQLLQSCFSIEEFVHLRALKFIELDDDGESFFSDLPSMKHLLSFEIDVRINLPLIEIPLSVERLVINTPPNIYFDIDSSISMIHYERLRHLSLSYCSCKQLQQIFYRAVRLTSLKISLAFLTPEEMHTFNNFHQKQTRISPLVSLSLSINGAGEYHVIIFIIDIFLFFGRTIMQVHLERFLAPFKHLHRLELITMYCGGRFADANQWEKFLIKHLPRLLIFYFNFSSWQMNGDVIEQYRRPFWLDKHWYVAYDANTPSLFTVPYFAPSSMTHLPDPITPNNTTLPIEQHFLFYDCVTELHLNSDRYQLPYRYNYVNQLILNDVFNHENVLDLSKIQSFIVNTSQWSLNKIITLIKERMPSVNYLSLNCTHPTMNYENISLKQIRILCLPQYGRLEDRDQFNWSRLFPSIERLIVSINSKNQIRFLLSQFKNIISGSFSIETYYMDKRIPITRQWLEKHLHRSKGHNINNFIYQINNQFLFSLSLWIAKNDET